MNPTVKARLAWAVASGLLLACVGWAYAADRDLEQGLGHLRSGNYPQATHHLEAYRDQASDSEIRAKVEQALSAMAGSLSAEGRMSVASNLEESIRTYVAFKRRLALDWRNRSFPPFP